MFLYRFQIDRLIERPTNRQIDRQAGRQADRQAHIARGSGEPAESVRGGRTKIWATHPLLPGHQESPGSPSDPPSEPPRPTKRIQELPRPTQDCPSQRATQSDPRAPNEPQQAPKSSTQIAVHHGITVAALQCPCCLRSPTDAASNPLRPNQPRP